MRVFVVGTGRCGTVTFAKACQTIKNYTCSHEGHKGRVGDLDYPNNHIEVDPHIVWVMSLLRAKYPDAYWVHLIRERRACITSLEKRQSLVHWCRFACQAAPDLKRAAEIHYDNTNAMIPRLRGKGMMFHLEEAELHWPNFMAALRAEGDPRRGIVEFRKKYNASKK